MLICLLKNKTICFSNLLNAAHTKETEPEDMEKFSRFVYVRY